MLVISDSNKMFNSPTEPLISSTLDDLFADLLTVKKSNCPNWKDDTTSDLGNQILWMFTVLTDWLNQKVNVVKNNSFLISASDREHIKKLCSLIGYTLGEATAASVDVTFTLESGNPGVTIEKGTKVSTVETDQNTSIIFETTNDVIVPAGTTSVVISCIQGETIEDEIIGSSDGSVNQSYILNNDQVIWKSDIVEVYQSGSWTSWTRVDNFIDSGPSDKHYTISVSEDDEYTISFGDGVNGTIPQRGINNIRVTYRRGGGSIGNVASGTITELVSTVDYITSITNINPSSGGSDRETIEHAKLFAPNSIKTMNRIVTLYDLEKITESYVSTNYGGIIKAKAYKTGALAINVMIVPQSGELPDNGFKSELQTYLNNYKMIGTSLKVVDPNYKYIDITVDIYIKSGYVTTQVIGKVNSRLVSYISPLYQDPVTKLYPWGFGRSIYLSDLYSVVNTTNGVDHCQISTPTGDIIVSTYEIVMVRDININAIGDKDGIGYYSDRDMLSNLES